MSSLAILLHAHLPYVRHPEHEEFYEEDWFFEAITETYLPLLDVLSRLAEEGLGITVTLSLSPTLGEMMRDPLLLRRYDRYLERVMRLAQREAERRGSDPRFAEVSRFFAQRLAQLHGDWHTRWKRDLLGAFRMLAERGILELITCAATHGFLPLLAEQPEVVRAQILIARDWFREVFGQDPKGIWLPECAFTPGLDAMLAEAGFRWFVLDAHGLLFGTPRPQHAIYAPCFTPAGPAAFARDRESSRQVWSAETGYPGDPAYRDFYRDVGFELPPEELGGFILPNGGRRFTGLKYWRITGRTDNKDPYRRDWAMSAVEAHATHFFHARLAQFAELRAAMSKEPILVVPFDAELFGHWWFEGPEWLEAFLLKAARNQSEFRLRTPTQYLDEHDTAQIVTPSASSWGDQGYWGVWLDESNSWIYPHLHMAGRRMVQQAAHWAQKERVPKRVDRALRQMAIELLLAQASDWAFLMKTGTARDYATRRTKDHIIRFSRLYDQVRSGEVDESFLAKCEASDNLFARLDWRVYLPAS